MWPDDDTLHTAWVTLVADLDTAEEFTRLVLEPLIAQLARSNRTADPHDVEEAAGNAVMAFLKRPGAYDPSRSLLRSYLTLIANRKLRSAFDRESKHRQNRIPWDSVELDQFNGNEEEDTDDELPSLDSPEVQSVVAGFDTEERTAFNLIRNGERETAAFATALGWTGDATDDVKRLKDRVIKRLQRALRRTP